MMPGDLLRCGGTRLPRRAGRAGGAGDPQGHPAQPAGLKVPGTAANSHQISLAGLSGADSKGRQTLVKGTVMLLRLNSLLTCLLLLMLSVFGV